MMCTYIFKIRVEEISTANEMQKEKLIEAYITIKELSANVKVKDEEIDTCNKRYIRMCVYVHMRILA